MERDPLSDCMACEKDKIIRFYKDLNNHKETKVRFEKLLKSEQKCKSVPMCTYSSFLIYLIELKDFSTAQEYYEKIKIEIMKNPRFLFEQSEIISYLVMVDELKKALKYFEKQFPIAMACTSILDKHTYYIAAELLFKKIKQTSPKKVIHLKLQKNEFLFKNGNLWDLNEIINFFETKNIDIALKFDKRNQNSKFTENYKRLQELAGVLAK